MGDSIFDGIGMPSNRKSRQTSMSDSLSSGRLPEDDLLDFEQLQPKVSGKAPWVPAKEESVPFDFDNCIDLE